MDLFPLLDEDGSGSLAIEEFLNGTRKIRGAARARDMMELKAEVRTLKQLCGGTTSHSEESIWKEQKDRLKFAFKQVDADGDGEVTIDEFLEGTRKLRGAARAKELVFLSRDVQRL